MSDLIVTYDNLPSPEPACFKEPPEPTKKIPNPKDDCFLILPLVDSSDETAQPHFLRFDRQKRTFLLSNQNTTEDLNWVSSHGNTSQLVDILRISETVMRLLNNPGTSDSYAIFLTVGQFLVTGRVRIKDLSLQPELKETHSPEYKMASYLLEIYSHNPETALQKLLGGITSFRGDANISKEISDRIVWIQDVFALRPTYLKFRGHFVNEDKLGMGKNDKIPEESMEKIAKILRFCRRIVILNWQDQPFRYYEKDFREAYLAYQSLPKEYRGQDPESDFCFLLKSALGDLLGAGKLPDTFIKDCQAAVKLLELKPEAAIRKSLEYTLMGAEGKKLLQYLVKEESKEANMTIEWLQGRGVLGKAMDLVLKNIEIEVPKKEGDLPKITVNVAGLSLSLDLFTEEDLLHRREYILVALAFIRRLFDETGQPLGVRVFSQGDFKEVSLKVKDGKSKDVLRLMRSIERKFDVSEKRTETILPWVELGTCAVGVAGLAVSEWVDPIAEREDLRFGMGLTSSTIAGAGCLARVGHEVWPEVATVRNRWAWDGLSGVGGAVIGAGIYLIFNYFKSSPGDDTEFGVDEFGK